MLKTILSIQGCEDEALTIPSKELPLMAAFLLPKISYNQLKCPCGEMDITTDFGSVVGGSNPSGGAKADLVVSCMPPDLLLVSVGFEQEGGRGNSSFPVLEALETEGFEKRACERVQSCPAHI